MKRTHIAHVQEKKSLAYKRMVEGMVFLKYGRYGYPKQKHVYFDGSALRWRANTKEGHKGIEKSSNFRRGQGKKIDLTGSNGEYEIVTGREGKSFARFRVSKEDEALSFTLRVKNKQNELSRDLCL